MIDKKRLTEVEKNIPMYIEEMLIKKDVEHKKLVNFYRNTAKMSVQVADILFDISRSTKSKETLTIEKEFECYLWVTVSAYYAMFYISNAALATLSIKVGDKIAHKITSDCLVFYFIKTERLAKHYYEEYEQSMDEALGVMNIDEDAFKRKMQEKAINLISTFDFEKRKRGNYQYKTNTSIKENVAKTSLERAKVFLYEMEKAIDKRNR
jgi:uncharacterized protein (UPF0332 family)